MNKESYQDPKVALVAKVKCLKSIEFHTRFFFMAQYNRKFILGEHHKIICAALERVINGDCLRLIINIAPRYGKTELAVKSFISHGLALNPGAKFIHLSYSDQLALDNSEAIKDLVSSDEYQTLFPDVQIKKDSRAKDKWYTTAGGGVLARSASGQVTGFGAGLVDDEMDEFMNDSDPDSVEGLEKKLLFGGAIIIDDPIKPEDADQETIRNKVNSRFDSTIRNRVNSRKTPIVVIMQRLHPEDLAGYLQRDDEADKWEVISLPCLINTGAKESNGEIAYRSLWPHKHTVDELLRLQKNNDLVFGRQYQQDPSPKTGLMFPASELNYFDADEMEDDLNNADHVFVPVDPANEGGDDFAAGPFKLIGDKIYLTEVLYNEEGSDFNEPEVMEMVWRNNARSVGVEGVLGWIESANRIREGLNRIRAGKRFQGDFRVLRPRTNKHSRIYNRSSFIKNNFYFRRDYAQHPQYAKFMRVLTSYLKVQAPGASNKHDDAPDLCEMAGSYFERNFKHLWGL